MNEELDRAIRDRLEVEFHYKGLPRIVQPAAHGLHVTTGNHFLRGYQIAGQSSTRFPPLWDMFTLSKIESLVVTDRHFEVIPPDYSRDDKHMATIYAQL